MLLFRYVIVVDCCVRAFDDGSPSLHDNPRGTRRETILFRVEDDTITLQKIQRFVDRMFRSTAARNRHVAFWMRQGQASANDGLTPSSFRIDSFKVAWESALQEL